MTKVLYARIDEAAHAYLADLAKRSGMSMAAVTSAVLLEAMRRGWDIEPRPSLITEGMRNGLKSAH